MNNKINFGNWKFKYNELVQNMAPKTNSPNIPENQHNQFDFGNQIREYWFTFWINKHQQWKIML